MTTLRAALWIFHDVTLPSWREHRLRTILTLIGVMIGVQAVVGISLVNRATLASFERTAEAIAGGADLQIANGTAGVPESLIEAVANLPGVASAAGLIQGTLRTDWGALTVFGADLLADQRIRQTQFPAKYVHIADELAFVNASDSIALSEAFASRNHLVVGSQLDVIAPVGRTTLTVRGVLEPVGPAALFDGAVALVDAPTAQRIFGLEGRVHQVDIMLVDKSAGRIVREQIKPLVAGAGTIEPPAQRAARLGTMLGGVQTVLTLVGLFAIVVGAFIIYHTMQTAIMQRRHDHALARAVGYARGDLAGAITLEAIAFGLVGALVGVVLAQQGARLAIGIVTEGIGSVWAHIDRPELTLTMRDVRLACVLGVAMSLVAAAAPMRETFRMQVIEQLRNASPGVSTARPLVFAAIGIVLVASGLALFASDLRPDGFNAKIAYIMASVMLVALGCIVLTPLVTAPVLLALAYIARRLPGVSLALATEHLASDARRSRDAIAALMLAFAMVLIVGAFVMSLRGSMMTWLAQTLAFDLWAGPTMQIPLPSSPILSDEVVQLARQIPGVVEVSPSRAINVAVGNSVAVLRSESFGGIVRIAYPVVESVSKDWLARVQSGEAIIVSDNLAYHQGLHAGDVMEFDTPTGRATFAIGAVVIDYTLDVGAIVIERATYERVWQDHMVNSIGIWTANVDPETVRSKLYERSAAHVPIVVLSGSEFRGMIGKAMDDALAATYAIQLLAMAIALIGVFNFFLADVEDRRREIGLLRGVALDAGQVMRVLVVEALIIGALGGLMAVLYAWPVSLMLVTRSTRLISGWQLTFTFPRLLVLVTIALAAVTSMIAAYYPARRATRIPIGELIGVD